MRSAEGVFESSAIYVTEYNTSSFQTATSEVRIFGTPIGVVNGKLSLLFEFPSRSYAMSTIPFPSVSGVVQSDQ